MIFRSLAVAAAFALGASAAGAATVSNVSGTVCEGGVTPADASGCPTGQNLGDFNSDVTNPTLEVVGDTRIWGGVAHRSATEFQDNWTIDFGSKIFAGVFNWQVVLPEDDRSASGIFDGELIVGGTSYTFTTGDPLVNSTGSFGIGNLTGEVTFILDAVAGDFGFDPDEVATWDMELSQVPLPAGAWLLLTALGGLAVARRRGAA
jgi:hypothetical protein